MIAPIAIPKLPISAALSPIIWRASSGATLAASVTVALAEFIVSLAIFCALLAKPVAWLRTEETASRTSPWSDCVRSIASPIISLALSAAGAAASSGSLTHSLRAQRQARPQSSSDNGSGEKAWDARAGPEFGTAIAVPAAIACIGFSLACCFSKSTQLEALVLMKSDTSDLICCGETL